MTEILTTPPNEEDLLLGGTKKGLFAQRRRGNLHVTTQRQLAEWKATVKDPAAQVRGPRQPSPSPPPPPRQQRERRRDPRLIVRLKRVIALADQQPEPPTRKKIVATLQSLLGDSA
eukprot:155808-Pyramimonas_sp.AAC.1